MTQCYIRVDEGTRHRCDNCGKVFDADELDMITDIQERLTPNSPVPSGQCPECSCLTYQLRTDTPPHNSAVGEIAADDGDASKHCLCRNSGMGGKILKRDS